MPYREDLNFRAVRERLPAGVYACDPDGLITYFNEQAVALWGREPRLNDPIDRFCGSFRLLSSEGAPISHDECWMALALKRNRSFEKEEIFIEREDGSRSCVLVHASPFHDESGSLAGAVNIVLDITARKRAEQNASFLAEASGALADLVDYESTLGKIGTLAVPKFADWTAVHMVTGDGRLRQISIHHADAAKLSLAQRFLEQHPPRLDDARGAGQVAGSGDAELAENIGDPPVTEAVDDAGSMSGPREPNLESYISAPMTLRGETIGVMTFAMAESRRRFDAADLTVARDLANRAAVAVDNARLYQALYQSGRRKDQFLATLAHELRNPLAPIRAGLELLKTAKDDPALMERTRDTMERQTEQLIALVDDLLDVSRITNGKLGLRKRHVAVSEIVRSAVEASKPSIDEAGHELTVSLPEDSLWVHADPHRLAQTLSNLLNNAARYTPEPGRIWLSAERSGNEVLLSVKDAGIGIRQDMQDRIFEMFAQTERSEELVHSGLGIGLSLVKSFVEMHGGRVEVHSDGPNTGSEFRIFLAMAEPLLEERSAVQTAAPMSKRRVLVVDDNKAAASMLSLIIQGFGNEVRMANDGRRAIEVASEFLPDLVLMDIGMPEMNGYQAAQHIRQQPWGREMVLIALTGWGQDQDRQRTKDAGFDRHLIKPIEPASLRHLLSETAREPA